MKYTGKIEGKSVLAGKKGNYTQFNLGGKKWNSFDKERNDKYQVGDIVEIETEQNGKYENMIFMKIVNGLTQAEIPKAETHVKPASIQTEIPISKVINMTEKPHSFEVGKSSSRHKIYYSNLKELEKHLTALRNMGLLEAMETEANFDNLPVPSPEDMVGEPKREFN